MKDCKHLWLYIEKMWGKEDACRCLRCGKFGFLKHGKIYTWDQPYAMPGGF